MNEALGAEGNRTHADVSKPAPVRPSASESLLGPKDDIVCIAESRDK